jgi:CubicO group peptidase (beta-lactamase class C family)
MLLNEGELDGQRLISRKSVELMRSPRIDWDGDGRADFGLGFQIGGDLGKAGEIGSEGAYSWGGAFNTSYWIDPEEGLIGVFMSQVRPTTSDISARFQTLVYQALE